ncbi:adenylate/guanylate cyclase domain-containing protein [Oscillatoria sp. FACHB-1406]|uniref:adenylate/guanylate cyclase domain-containing protein n=1 Tax=Oscillatoria sp. FACHB-1406 TaxID=2692846 RepID=UPI001682E33B|nr:adenylate/guanylate cyclase domain-containing protein [Oscillatoria sp. FACHB-1406]MBD2577536.1 PAS domain-containing protein [Oscillatoria sp. FACHB-1406]
MSAQWTTAVEFLKALFAPNRYLSDGHCYLGQAPLIKLHAIGDLALALAYFSIPVLLVCCLQQRRDAPFPQFFWVFSVFINLCGLEHLLEVWVLWHPASWLMGLVKAVAALASFYTTLKIIECWSQLLSLQTPGELDRANQQLQQEMLERQRTEQILKHILEGTASVTGEVFFSALVQNLALALNVSNVFLAERVGDNPKRLKTLAFYGNGKMADNIEYELAGTPCEPVLERGELQYYPTNVQQCFPEAAALAAMNAQCYLGVPLFDSEQKPIGVLCFNSDRALEGEETAKAILQIFAARVTTELQRLRAESALRLVCDELDLRVQERTAELAKANAALQLREARLQGQQAGLVALARNQNLYQGNLSASLPYITQLASYLLAVERCGVWLYNQDRSAICCVNLYECWENRHSKGQRRTRVDWPGSFQPVEAGETIATSQVFDTCNLEMPTGRDYLLAEKFGLLNVPIYIEGDCIGLLCLEYANPTRIWEIDEQNFVSYLAYMTALAMETSDRKQMEAALKKSEKQLRLIIDALPVCISYVSAKQRYELINKSYETWFHCSQDQIRGKLLEEVLGKAGYEIVRPYVERALQGETVRYEARVPYPVVGMRDIDAMLVPDIDESDGVKGYYALISDISDRKKVEQALKQEIEERRKTELELRLAREQSDRLLCNILPEQIARKLKQGKRTLAEHFNEVTILFADLVGFTPLAAEIEPIALVDLLNQIFSTFDRLAERYGLEKIKTIGDAYVVVGGLPVAQENHAQAIAEMALQMQCAIAEFNLQQTRSFQMRIGINTGSVVAGVIGIKKFSYDLWGDAVNVAARMESLGEPGRIHVAPEAYNRLKAHYCFEERGTIDVKGKGDMTTYWLTSRKANPAFQPLKSSLDIVHPPVRERDLKSKVYKDVS